MSLLPVFFLAASVTITPDYKVVVPEPLPNGVPTLLYEAAKEFANDYREATGHPIEIVRTNVVQRGGKYVFIGEQFARKAGLWPKDAPLKNFQNVVAERGGHVFLFGHDESSFADPNRDVRWAVYAVLPSVKALCNFMEREMGVRFLMPGRIGREVPKGEVRVEQGLYRRQNPTQDAGPGRDFEMMWDIASGNFGRGHYYVQGGHLYPDAVPRQVYGETHPEYFVMENGKRWPTTGSNALCISNPEVEQLIVDFIIKRMDEGYDVVELGQNDGPTFCHCPACDAIGGLPRKENGEKLWIFHRRIAERVCKLRPNKTVLIINYGQTAYPPKTFREFPPNVAIECAVSCNSVAHEIWKDYKVPRGFSYYIYHWGNYEQPGYTVQSCVPQLAREARKYVRHGVRMLYRCGYGEKPGTEGPEYYVFNHVLQDPSLDENALFEEYVTACYGPAADEMRKFHELVERRVRPYTRTREAYDKPGDLYPTVAASVGGAREALTMIYPPEVLQELDACLKKAEATPNLPWKVAMRLKEVRLEFDYTLKLMKPLHLYQAYRAQPLPQLREALADALVDRNRFLDELYAGDRPKSLWHGIKLFYYDKREMVQENGRLRARIAEPLALDPEKVRKGEF